MRPALAFAQAFDDAAPRLVGARARQAPRFLCRVEIVSSATAELGDPGFNPIRRRTTL
jgi:hypothetical protein